MYINSKWQSGFSRTINGLQPIFRYCINLCVRTLNKQENQLLWNDAF